MTRPIAAAVVTFAVVVALSVSLAGEKSQPAQEWKLIGKFGIIRTVYVSPDGLKDKFFVAQVLHALVTKEDSSKPIQLMMFDDVRFTPQGFPMTDAQMLHLKAQYNKNPNTKHERFVWISVTDSKSSPPGLKETEAPIRPGYAE